MSLLAAIDQGTTGTRCFLFDLAGRVVASAYREHAQTFPHPGWVQAAGLACGAYGSIAELSSLWREDRTFEPQWSAARREEAYRGWARAVNRSRGWIES